jgi:hypothetical protein
LAKFLLSIKDSSLLVEAQKLKIFLPWPIATLLVEIDDVSRLKEFAAMAEEGRFGNRDIWASAQERWREHGLTREDFIYSSQAPYPMDNISVIGTPDFTAYGISRGHEETLALATELYLLAKDVRVSSPLVAKLLTMSQFSLIGLRADCVFLTGDQALDFIKMNIESSVPINSYSLHFLPQEIWDVDEAAELLGEVMIRRQNYFPENRTFEAKFLVQSFNRNPERRGLLNVLACSLPEINFKELSSLDSSAFEWRASDGDYTKMATILLSLAADKPVKAELLAKCICSLLPDAAQTNILSLICDLLENDQFMATSRENHLATILRHLEGKHVHINIKLREVFGQVLNKRRSKLSSQEIWIDKLSLPSDAYPILQTSC